jgi:hypothetical protein
MCQESYLLYSNVKANFSKVSNFMAIYSFIFENFALTLHFDRDENYDQIFSITNYILDWRYSSKIQIYSSRT